MTFSYRSGRFFKKLKQGVTLLICFCDNQGWRGKKFNFFNNTETNGKKNAIVSGVGIKIFEKSSKRVLQNRGVILIISGERKFFRTFFSKVATQRGSVLEITPVDGGMQATFRRIALEVKMAQKLLQVGDMVGVDIKIFQFFLKNVQHFGGEKLIISGVGGMFFRFFF